MSKGKFFVMAVVAAMTLAGCGRSAQDKAAYEACLTAAKKDPKLASAKLASFEDSKITGSTGEEEIRVNIPYEQDGKKAIFQCIAQKQADGTFKVVF
ncbi:MAG TPA: hypothetical protein VEC60_07460 [Reyranella sp.]|nr:hypothetical protein [Reyranella sp.]